MKVFVITGVTKGLGYALTAELIQQGHTVFGCGRKESKIQALTQKFGSSHDFACVDVTDQAQVQAWGDRLLNHHQAPDYLLNNAGVVNSPTPLWKIPAPEFDQLIDVNIKGVANVIRTFVPAMVQRKQGFILNLSSGWGRYAAAEVAPYCASKFAIEGLTQSLAQELPSGMAAIPLSPGIIDTEMLQTVYGDHASDYISPEAWAKKAAKYLLQLTPETNGKSLAIPS